MGHLTEQELLSKPDVVQTESDQSPGATTPVSSKSNPGKAVVAGLANIIPGSNQAGAGIVAAFQKMMPEKFGGAPSDMTLSELYDMARQGQTNETNEAKKNNPGTYYTTNIAGSIPMYATGAAEGGALLKAAPTIGKMLGAGAVGTAQGASNSQANTVGGVAKDAAISGGLAMGGEGAAQVIGKGLGAAVDKGNDLLHSQLIEKWLKDPEAVKAELGVLKNETGPAVEELRAQAEAGEANPSSSDLVDSIKKSILGRLATTGIAGATGGVIGNQFDSPVLGSVIGASAGAGMGPELLASGAKGMSHIRDVLPSAVVQGSKTAAEGAFPTVGTKASGYASPPASPEEDNLDRINSYLSQTTPGHTDQITP